jgi:hypothetical protein
MQSEERRVPLTIPGARGPADHAYSPKRVLESGCSEARISAAIGGSWLALRPGMGTLGRVVRADVHIGTCPRSSRRWKSSPSPARSSRWSTTSRSPPGWPRSPPTRAPRSRARPTRASTARSARSSGPTPAPTPSRASACAPTATNSSAPAARPRRSPSTCPRRTLAAALGTDGVRNVRGAKFARGKPRALSAEQYARLLRMPDLRTTAGKRDLALLNLLGTAGLRRAEAGALLEVERRRAPARRRRAAAPRDRAIRRPWVTVRRAKRGRRRRRRARAGRA